MLCHINPLPVVRDRVFCFKGDCSQAPDYPARLADRGSHSRARTHYPQLS
jgi:hypothetical protein